MEETPCIKLKIGLQTRHSTVFDLSGTNPFDVYFEVDRFRGDGGGWRSFTLLLNGSLLDVPHALTNGLLELIDLDADCKIVFKAKDDGMLGLLYQFGPTLPSKLHTQSLTVVSSRGPKMRILLHSRGQRSQGIGC